MLSYEDCVAFSKLTPAEIDAIAEHEHIPQIVAVEFGNYLMTCPDGTKRLRRIILDDIAAARKRGDEPHALALKLILAKFIQEHPPTDHAGNRADADISGHQPKER